ncbi:MAG: DsbA family protein [Nitrososphaeraceae archaeon]
MKVDNLRWFTEGKSYRSFVKTKLLAHLCKPVIAAITLIFASMVVISYAHAITYATYADTEFAFEYPAGWVVEVKESRFDQGPDIKVTPSTSDGQSDVIQIYKLPEMLTTSLESMAQGQLNAELANYRFDTDLEARVIEGVSVDELRIDSETAATFLVATYDRDTKDVLYANEFAIANHNGHDYLFIYGNIARQFDSPEATEIRGHFFNSIKWITPATKDLAVIQRIVAPISENVPVLTSDGGSSNMTMVEFGDYQCQDCARFHNETKDQIINNFVDTGQLRFIFKDFVINDLPSDRASTLAAEASYCAADQGQYWQYHDELYDNSRGENTGWVTEDSLKQFATRLGIQNLTEFSECLDNHTHRDLVEANTQLANGIGLTSTPSFVIISNETVPIAIEGAQPYSVFEQVISEVVTNASRT